MKNKKRCLKESTNNFQIIIFAIAALILISFPQVTNSLKKEKEEISDAELDAMLKDPKYSSLLGNNAEELLKASPELQKSKPKGSKQESISLDNLDLKELDSLAASPSSKKKEKEDKVEDKFQTYDFITKQQARYLIEILKQPVFFNMLPSEAQSIVKVTKDNFQFKMTEDGKIDEFIEASMVNTPSSQSFIDPDGQVGRKGILTVIDPLNAASRFVWAVLNAKTFTLFESQSFLTIVKLYRTSSLGVKDVPATPCFMTMNTKSNSEGSLLICSTSTQEKEVWVQTILTAVNGNKTSFLK